VLTLEAPWIVRILRDHTPLPVHRISLGYARNWRPMTETDLAVSGTELDRDFATNEYRRVVASDTTVWNPATQTGKHPRARDLTIDTLWNDAADAQQEVDAMLALMKADRHLYLVTMRGQQFRMRVGNTVRLVHRRFGLAAGREMVVLGVTENTTTGFTDLRLWG
jgi:hypothetical protein